MTAQSPEGNNGKTEERRGEERREGGREGGRDGGRKIITHVHEYIHGG